MTEQELLQMRDLAEDGKLQFKERANDRYDISCEIVAFCNSRGGQLVIGINDKTGVINALSYQELQEATNLLTNIASENVIPNILIEVENVPVKGGGVVIDQAIHSIDLVNWIVDSEIENVSCSMHNRGHSIVSVEDSAEGLITYINEKG